MALKTKVYEEPGDGTRKDSLVAANTTVAQLTDSTTGTADDTLADVGASFNQGTLNNNFADLAAKVNALLTACKDHGIIASS